ncbi:VRK3 isoform 21 [Pongo abelii]|uniref:VRK3 isoform 14 n=1 Tax=Pongo abelii TaxID=9601 RepID=A0A2J8U8P9_PONAB|nr:VRK3 isoform 14 [Pongo abelii]PNJ41662.1 VRK3 isoform 21 [Pongo abelii]
MISFCPDCGKSIQAAFKFCPYCGNSLPIEEHAGSQTFVNPHVLSFQAWTPLLGGDRCAACQLGTCRLKERAELQF